VIAKFASVAPAGTVTEAGTPTEAVSELRVTTDPPVGAGALRVAVPVTTVVDPPTTVVGEIVTDLRLGGLTVSVAVLITPFNVALIFGSF